MPNYEVINDIIIKSPAISPYSTAKLSGIKINLNANTISATGDKKLLIPVIGALLRLTGQRPRPTKATESVAAFRVRKFMEIGAEINLRGKTLRSFVGKLRILLPQIGGGLNTAGLATVSTISQHRRIGIKDLSALIGVNPAIGSGLGALASNQKQKVGGAHLEFQFKGVEGIPLSLSRLGIPRGPVRT